MSRQLLPCVEIEPRLPAKAAVIWLHGLGADGHDFEPVVPELRLPEAMAVRFVFPHAPKRPVTINGGFVMPAWYDIFDLDRKGPQDEAGIRDSERLLLDLVARENERGIPRSKIVLAGFSQGGAIVLHTGLRAKDPFAGIMALSCHLPLDSLFETERSETAKQTPIFMAHGSHDPMIPIVFGEESKRIMVQAGYRVDWHAYPMPHSVCAPELADIRKWLVEVLPA